MLDSNDAPKTKIGWLGLISGSVLLTFSAMAWAGGPPVQQGKPAIIEEPAGKPTQSESDSSRPTQTAPASTLQPREQTRPQTTGDLPPRFPFPSATVSPVNGQVTLKLINPSNVVVEYQVASGTRPMLLGQQSETTLKFPVSLNLTYQREDGGLLLVRPTVTGPGVLEVRFEATGDINLDTRSLSINEQGTVFLN